MDGNGITGIHLDELQKLTPGSVMYSHFQYTPELFSEMNRLNVRPFYIYRDLRDSLVSEYFHKNYLDADRFRIASPILNEVTDETAFDLQNILQWSTVAPFYKDDVVAWVRCKKLPTVKFEDMARDPKSSLKSLLAFYEMNFTDSDLETAIHAARFQAMSGRETGNEDRKNHYRKGIVGDWRNYLSERQNADLLARYGKPLRRLGYISWRERIRAACSNIWQ